MVESMLSLRIDDASFSIYIYDLSVRNKCYSEHNILLWLVSLKNYDALRSVEEKSREVFSGY